MAISKKLKDYLSKQKVKYEVLSHPVAYSASRVAGSQHLEGKRLAKAVVVEADGDYIMCVLPAVHLIDFEKFKRIAGVKEVHLATEEELAQLFPDYDLGAEPPFGNLFGLSVYADSMLQRDEEIYFNGGSHTDLVKMKFKDYVSLVTPVVADFGKPI